MPLPREYVNQPCSLARALEIVGERWTLLIVRDAFYGVRRFSDFLTHLQIPRAVLTERLGALVEAGVLERVAAASGHDEYVTTDKGRSLWPAVLALVSWGDDHYAVGGPRRRFLHVDCGTEVDAGSICPTCALPVGVGAISVVPGPGLACEMERDDPVSVALAEPHRMLEALDTKRPRRSWPSAS